MKYINNTKIFICTIFLCMAALNLAAQQQPQDKELEVLVQKLDYYNQTMTQKFTNQVDLPTGDLTNASQEDLARIENILSNKFRISDPRIDILKKILEHYENN